MPDNMPKWIEARYRALYDCFGRDEFRREQAVEALKDFGDDPKNVSVILSELRKLGLSEVELDPQDNRSRIYRLVNIEDVIRESLRPQGEEIKKEELYGLLKKAADLIRTRVDYKYILVLLFLKRLSDRWEMEYEKKIEELMEMGLPEEAAKEEAKMPEYHQFNMPEKYLWENIRKDVNRLPERLSEAIKYIAEMNPDLRGIFDTLEFTSFTGNSENLVILNQLMELFSSRKLHDTSSDILGDAYEWVLKYFAPQKAKEGEVYTPREVINLIVEILDPKPEESVYDPACGSGGMLIGAYKHVEKKYGKEGAKKLFLYGQEVNPTTYGLCKMNVYMHDIGDPKIERGDTLLYPKFKKGGRFRCFDNVIANPPWNQDGYDENTLKQGEYYKKRYGYGYPPKQSADWAWIQHMLASTKDGGKVGIVLDNGALFRSGKEKAIRKKVLEENEGEGLLDCVILLPEKLFYNTGAPGAILIFNKGKDEDRKRKVLFINASQEYVKHPDVRKLNMLGEENIRKISQAYREFSEEEGFSRIVPIEEIRENDYNLNVTLYVFPEEEIEEIDVEKEWEELKEIEERISQVETRMEGYLRVIR